jgi:prepilin peptidase CpaA
MMISTFAHLSILVFFPALMALSASMDLLTFTIPNRICAILALGYFALAAHIGLSGVEILLNASCAAVVLAIAFLMFARGWVGGGDAKLAAATALWLGWSSILDYGITTAIYGGILTVFILTSRMMPLPSMFCRLAWIARLHDGNAGVPYGIALAGAGLAQYPSSRIWSAIIA